MQPSERPPHPVTGEPAAGHYCVVQKDGTIHWRPYWRKPKREVDQLTASPDTVWYSTSEVGRMIGRSGAAVSGYIRSGALPASRPPSASGRGRWMVRGSDLLAFVQARPRVAAEALNRASDGEAVE